MERKRKMVTQSVLPYLWCERHYQKPVYFCLSIHQKKKRNKECSPIRALHTASAKNVWMNRLSSCFVWIWCDIRLSVIHMLMNQKTGFIHTIYRLLHWNEWWQLTNTPKKSHRFPWCVRLPNQKRQCLWDTVIPDDVSALWKKNIVPLVMFWFLS